MATVEVRNRLQITGQASVYSEKCKPKGMVVTMKLCTASASMTEEPDVGKPHVWVCMEALGNWCSYHDF
jgi:hypothetical protein